MMRDPGTVTPSRRIPRALAVLAVLAWTVSPLSAQTITLTDGAATTLRGGSFASTAHGAEPITVTRTSDDPTYVRRTLLKFDTHTTIPAGSTVTSAVLTLTVRGGNPETRSLTAFRVPSSYDEATATWNRRNTSTSWGTPGGDLAEQVGTATVTNVPGTRISYDVTGMVRAIVRGDHGSSRYARFLLIDRGPSSRDSYKEYHSNEASDVRVRPTLVVTLGSTTTTSPSPSPSPTPTPTTTTQLRVLTWNIQHGTDAAGRYDIEKQADWIVRTGANVVTLQEVEKFTGWGYEDQPARFAAMLRARTGQTWHYHFAMRSGGTGNGQGNLILTTFPIEQRGHLALSYNRAVTRVQIMVNGFPVNIFTTHLDAESGSRRTTQMREMLSWAGGFTQQRIFTGDFNAWPGAAEITNMTSGHFDAWAEAVKLGVNVSFAGNEAGNTRNSRIDYVFYSKQATRLVLRQARVFDTRNSSGIMASDHRPLMATFDVR